jgi:hypothetical protein
MAWQEARGLNNRQDVDVSMHACCNEVQFIELNLNGKGGGEGGLDLTTTRRGLKEDHCEIPTT